MRDQSILAKAIGDEWKSLAKRLALDDKGKAKGLKGMDPREKDEKLDAMLD